ncbi:hypothetical protein D9M68_778010 [compost metagenome]
MLLPGSNRSQAGIEAVQAVLDVAQQQRAGLGEDDAAVDAVEQADRQLLFEALDLLADGRLTAALFGGSGGEAQVTGRGFKHPQHIQGQPRGALKHNLLLSESCIRRGFTRHLLGLIIKPAMSHKSFIWKTSGL